MYLSSKPRGTGDDNDVDMCFENVRQETDQVETHVDSGIIYAQNRKFEYRGKWAQLMDTKKSSTPLDNNQEEEILDGNEDDEVEIEDEEDCVTDSETDVYPLRFSALKETIMKNVKDTWPQVPIVSIKEASKHVFDFFDHELWVSGEVSTESYMESQDCQVIALVGVLRTFKPLEDKYTTQQFRQLRMTFVPSRKPTERGLKTIQLLNDTGEDGVVLISHESSETLNESKIISGIPCAVIGFVITNNRFVVSDIIYATPRPCTWPTTGKKIEMVFVSGLLFGDGIQEASIEVELLSDYLLDLCNCPDEQENRPKPRVFFVGNSFASVGTHYDEPSESEILQLSRASYELDSFFANLAAETEIIIIPGETDPTEKVLPQKPFDSSFFPRLCQQKFHKNYHNPCFVQVKEKTDEGYNKLNIILSSGSNIELVKRYLPKESTLSVAQNMLKWGHLNPAAKDFFPLKDNESATKDLFAITQSLPHLFVIGNQKHFMVREFKNTKIICLPKFAETRQVVALLQSDDDCYEIMPIRIGVCGE